MLDVAKATGDADLLITGHSSACICYCLVGELTKAVEHADKVLDLYDDDKHRHLAEIRNHDPKTSAGSWGSIGIWMLGYPDRALRLKRTKRRARPAARSPLRPWNGAELLGRMNSIIAMTTRICAGAPTKLSGWVGEQPAYAVGDVRTPVVWSGTDP